MMEKKMETTIQGLGVTPALNPRPQALNQDKLWHGVFNSLGWTRRGLEALSTSAETVQAFLHTILNPKPYIHWFPIGFRVEGPEFIGFGVWGLGLEFCTPGFQHHKAHCI